MHEKKYFERRNMAKRFTSNFPKARYFHSLALASCIVLYLCLSPGAFQIFAFAPISATGGEYQTPKLCSPLGDRG